MAARKPVTTTKRSFGTTTKSEPLVIDVNGEDYSFRPADQVPAFALLQYSQEVSAGNLLEAHKTLFSRVLLPDYTEVFLKKLEDDENPISLAIMIEIAEYIVSIYSDVKSK